MGKDTSQQVCVCVEGGRQKLPAAGHSLAGTRTPATEQLCFLLQNLLREKPQMQTDQLLLQYWLNHLEKVKDVREGTTEQSCRSRCPDTGLYVCGYHQVLGDACG